MLLGLYFESTLSMHHIKASMKFDRGAANSFGAFKFIALRVAFVSIFLSLHAHTVVLFSQLVHFWR